MESTSPGRAVVADGEGALSGGLVAGAGEVCETGFCASATQPTPRQSMKTAAKSFLMGNNLTPIVPLRKHEQRSCWPGGCLMLPDVGAHRRFVMRMLPLPPLQVVQVAAEGDGCALHGGNGDSIVNGRPTLAAHAHLDELLSNKSVPGNPSITALINA